MALSQSQKTAIIAASGSLSGAVYLGTKSLVGIQMPAAWTPADLTFQASVDGLTYADVYIGGSEYSEAAAASRWIPVSPASLEVSFIKIRSGTSAVAVAQDAARTLQLVLRRYVQP